MEYQVTVVSTYWVTADTAEKARERFTDVFIQPDLEDDTYVEFDGSNIEVNGY